MPRSHNNPLTKKTSSLTNASSVRVERVKLHTDSDEMTMRVQRMNEDVRNWQCTVSTEARKTYDGMDDAIMRKAQGDLVDRRKEWRLFLRSISFFSTKYRRRTVTTIF